MFELVQHSLSFLPEILGSLLSTHSDNIPSILSGAHACIVPEHVGQGSILSANLATLLLVLLLQFRQISIALSLTNRTSKCSLNSLSDQEGSNRSFSLF